MSPSSPEGRNGQEFAGGVYEPPRMRQRTRTLGAPYARHAMAYVLAGGRGSRLMELTDRRAKPAVYFGGKSRIIDFALSNALNSGIRRIAVATQYKAHSLIRHLQHGWNFFRPERNESFDILPASQRVSETMWYLGTADAVYQNIDIIESYAPQYMVRARRRSHLQDGLRENAPAARRVEGRRDGGLPRSSLEEAKGFGVMHVDEEDSILSFLEKPKNPPPMPGKPDVALCSMGIYVFETKFLIEQLQARRRRSQFGPRFRQGHHSLPRRQRQSGRASFLAFLRRRQRRGADLLARRRDRRRLLGGQHRPDRRAPRSRPLRSGLAALDLRRNYPAGQIRPRRRRSPRRRYFLAGLGRLHRFRRGDFAVFAVHRRVGPFLLDDPRGRGPALFRIGRGFRLDPR